jgi:hypothetical protein
MPSTKTIAIILGLGLAWYLYRYYNATQMWY